MQIGIDSFAAAYDEASRAINTADRLRNLVERSNMPTRWVWTSLASENITVGTTSIPRLWSFSARRRHERAAALGLPLMVAIIGGEPRRLRPLIDPSA